MILAILRPFVLLLALLAPPVAAQPSHESAPPLPSVQDDIVVTGQDLETLDRYVEELTEVRPGGQLARWNDPVCPRAVGLELGQNSYLALRIADTARELRIPVARNNCRPNILIVVTDEADAFARVLLKKHPRLFGAYGNGRPPASVVAALLAPRPVRWLNASRWANGDGAPVVDGNTNRVYFSSRLKWTTRENAALSLVIVDASRVDGLSWRALGLSGDGRALASGPRRGIPGGRGDDPLAVPRPCPEPPARPNPLGPGPAEVALCLAGGQVGLEPAPHDREPVETVARS